jgi:hypothetical protein
MQITNIRALIDCLALFSFSLIVYRITVYYPKRQNKKFSKVDKDEKLY